MKTNKGELKHMTQQPAFAQAFPMRLVDVIPRQTNDEVDAGIQRSNRERLANEPFIDRRDPGTIQTQIEGLKRTEAMQRDNFDATQRKIVEITGQVAKLCKVLRTCEKQPSNLRTNVAILEAGEKLSAAEKELKALKDRAVRIEAGIKNATQHLKDFLAARPREEYLTNLELVQQYTERAQLEREARDT